MLKRRTYTEQVLRWKLIPPCSALFFDMGIWPRVRESRGTRRFPARARGLEKRVALLFALIAGLLGDGNETRSIPAKAGAVGTGPKARYCVNSPNRPCRYRAIRGPSRHRPCRSRR